MTVLALAGTTVTGVATVNPTVVTAKATKSSNVAKSKTTVDKIIKATQDNKDEDHGKPDTKGSKVINDAMYFKKGAYGYRTPSVKSDKMAKFKKGDSIIVVAVYSKAGGKKLSYKGEPCKWYKTNVGVFV